MKKTKKMKKTKTMKIEGGKVMEEMKYRIIAVKEGYKNRTDRLFESQFENYLTDSIDDIEGGNADWRELMFGGYTRDEISNIAGKDSDEDVKCTVTAFDAEDEDCKNPLCSVSAWQSDVAKELCKKYAEEAKETSR